VEEDIAVIVWLLWLYRGAVCYGGKRGAELLDDAWAG